MAERLFHTVDLFGYLLLTQSGFFPPFMKKMLQKLLKLWNLAEVREPREPAPCSWVTG